MKFSSRLSRDQFNQVRDFLNGVDRARYEDDATNPFEIDTVNADGTVIRLVVYEGSDIVGSFVKGNEGPGEYWKNRSFVFCIVDGYQLYWIDELSAEAFIEGDTYRLDEDGIDTVKLVVE